LWKRSAGEETLLGDTNASGEAQRMLEKLERKTAHVKVLVNDVWRELRVLSVVTVKDVKKGLEKHFGIPR
jgi:hypothetical protein